MSKVDCTGYLARGFLHTSRQIRHQIDATASAKTARARNIFISSNPITVLADTVFYVAMPTYLALGAFGERRNGRPICGGVPGDLPGYNMRDKPSRNTGLVFCDEIAEHIVAAGRIDQATAPDGDGRLQVICSTEWVV